MGVYRPGFNRPGLGRRWVGSKRDTTDPSVPAGLTATPVSSSEIDLAWSASTDNAPSGVKEYTVRRDGVVIATVTHPTVTYSDTGLDPGTEYGYTVSATDFSGNESAETAEELATTDAAPVGASNRAIYRMWVGWEGRNAGAFQIGVSTLGGTDKIGWAYTEDFGSTAYDNVTADCHDAEIRRGRSDDLALVNAGSCDLELINLTNLYGVKTVGPLAGIVKSMRPVKVEMSTDGGGTWKPRFYGWSDEHKTDPRTNSRRATIHAADVIDAILPQVFPVIEATGPTTVGAAIGLVLDACEWEDPARRDLPDGDSIPDFTADGTKSALQLIQELLVIDPQGFLYQDPSGVVVYGQRWGRYDPTVDFTIADEMIAIAPGQRLADVINEQTVIVETPAEDDEEAPQTAEDGDSKAVYGRRKGSDINTVYLSTDEDGFRLATAIVTQRADGISAIYAMPLANKTGDLLDVISQVDLTDRVAITVTGLSFNDEYLIEGIEDHISDGGAVHRQSWSCSEAPDEDRFIIGTSTLGGTDVLVY